MTGYRVSLDAFEGPLDLLLYLVRHDEVDICDICLKRITGQYLAFLEDAQELDLPVAGEFIVMAAHLIHLKSRELLPQPPPIPGGEGDAEWDDDPRGELVRRLIEYKKFKEAAAQLGESHAQRTRLFPGHPPSLPCPVPQPGPAEQDPVDLLAAFRRVLERAGARERQSRIRDDRWTISGKIEDLRRSVARGKTVRFQALFRTRAAREEWIVTFLAILELMKNREFRASQNGYLDDIELRRL